MVARESFIWVQLHHENVLPLIGMVTVDDMPALVSEWMANGTMNDYLMAHEDVSMLELVRYSNVSKDIHLTLVHRQGVLLAAWNIYTTLA